MNALFPNSIKGWTALIANIDFPRAVHINEARDEITAIETELGINPKGSSASVGARFVDDERSIAALASPDGWVSMAQGWSYSSDDSPTFVASVNADMTNILSPGMRIKLTQTTVKYFIVTAVGSYSGGHTIITMYGGTDYTLTNQAITNGYYSTQKAPFGFPLQREKWTVSVNKTTAYPTDMGVVISNPTSGSWYNVTNFSGLSLPIGSWKLYYCVPVGIRSSPATLLMVKSTLSTSNNSETNHELTGAISASTTMTVTGILQSRANVTTNSKIFYYLNVGTDSTGASYLEVGTAYLLFIIIGAVCSYL